MTDRASVVPRFGDARLAWLAVIALALMLSLLPNLTPWLKQWPSAWNLPVPGWINAAMDAVSALLEPLTRWISSLLEQPMFLLRDILQWLPWPVTVLAVTLLAWHAKGWRLSLLCVLALLYIALSGYWTQAMNTMALVGIAVPLSLAIGLMIGVWAHRTQTGAKVVPPTLDLMQTMPTFAYLIPLLVLFGFGPVVGLIASAIYAAPPMVRNVHLGLKQVSPEIIEASRISGTTTLQQLLWVEIPAAMGQIKVGINQTIMAVLSMVIIASVIGGFDDIGWEVLSTMRKARFGESLLAGFVIVLIAVIMDRISSAYATSDSARDDGSKRGWLICIAALFALCAALKVAAIDTAIDNPAWVKSVTQWLDASLDNMVLHWGDLLTTIKNTYFYYYLLPIKIGFSQSILPFTWGFEFTPGMRTGYAIGALLLSLLISLRYSWRGALTIVAVAYLLYFGLTGAPWAVLVSALAVFAWQLGGPRLALLVSVAMGFIVLTGMWDRAMISVYLCGAAVVMSFLLGAALGVWAAVSNTVSAIVRPIADTFQTIPLFVFLIPVLMFFQIGEFTALLAIILYAFVPAIRYTENGLRQVPEELIEVAKEQGCTQWQIFWQVKLPLAMPGILVGLNQTVMYAFAMLVIAALVGTTGLGQEIFRALSSADTGRGIVAGLSMALLAIVTDRFIQAWAAKKYSHLDKA